MFAERGGGGGGGAAERWGVRKGDCWYSKESREPRSTLHLCFCSIWCSEIGNVAIVSLEGQGCENLTEIHAVSRCCWVLPLFELCLLCVKTSHEERGAAILRCYSLHTLPVALLVKTNLLVCQKNWDIECIFVVGWLVLLFFFFADRQTVTQWQTQEFMQHHCFYWTAVCVHDSHLTTRGRSATVQWTHYYCDHLQNIMLSSHLYQFPSLGLFSIAVNTFIKWKLTVDQCIFFFSHCTFQISHPPEEAHTRSKGFNTRSHPTEPV